MKPASYFPTAFALALACSAIGLAPHHDIQLNERSLRFAEQLIEQGHFVADKNGAWRGHQSSATEENEFIRVHGWSEYAKWHLGFDDRHAEKSKARYKFPFGDFKNVRRSALLAIRSRAREYGYTEIEAAAAELQRKLEFRSKLIQPSRESPSPQSSP